MTRKKSNQPPAEGETVEGIVIRSTGSWYEVQTEESVIRATMRGKFRLQGLESTNPVAVGDRVTLRVNKDGTGFILDIHQRINKLSRRAAGRRAGLEHIIVSNVDAALVIQSVQLPAFNPGFVDRFLVMAEAYDIRAGLVINKIDLIENEADREDVDYWKELYAHLGYTVLLTSALTGEGVEALCDEMAGKVNVVTGPSGVGKSALLNAIEPSLALRTGEVSEKTRKGKHTTTYASLYPLSVGGFVADTPGIREFGIWEMTPQELSGYFVEMQPLVPDCRYPSCTHEHEPDCAVIAAVEAGEISVERYESYLNILHSVKMGKEDVGR